MADGFHGSARHPGDVAVTQSRVSPLQERQIAGLGGNVSPSPWRSASTTARRW